MAEGLESAVEDYPGERENRLRSIAARKKDVAPLTQPLVELRDFVQRQSEKGERQPHERPRLEGGDAPMALRERTQQRRHAEPLNRCVPRRQVGFSIEIEEAGERPVRFAVERIQRRFLVAFGRTRSPSCAIATMVARERIRLIEASSRVGRPDTTEDRNGR